jgi:BAAT / Acyl-CoA thioester hydrolase C terminal/Acyl-CoA thioester hydrolase/BAAT N-terminal region
MLDRHFLCALRALLLIGLVSAFVAFVCLAANARAGTATPDDGCIPLPANFTATPAGSATPAAIFAEQHYGESVRFTVNPVSALEDARLAIRASGLAPGAPVTITATTTDARGTSWRAQATFVANANGRVDPAHDAPRYGTYGGVHAMGLVWSMQPVAVKDPASTIFASAEHGERITFTLSADTTTLATVAVTRLGASAGVHSEKVRTDGLVGVLYRPADSRPHPAVIVIGGSEGGLEPQIAQAALLASHGYVALGLAYFRAPGLPDSLVNIPLEYFEKAANWLVAQPGIAGKRVAIMGWSKGAEGALLVAATYPKLFRAAIAYAPSSVVNFGLTYGPGPQTSSWSLAGKPIPFAAYPMSSFHYTPGGKVSFRSGYLGALEAPDAASAAIPVEHIAGPVLLISGTDDQIWPSSIYVQRIMARLTTHRHAYRDVSLCYQGAGHMILWPYRPTVTSAAPFGAMTLELGGSLRSYAFADEDSWPKVLAFLERASH